jgi:hypothetical protein
MPSTPNSELSSPSTSKRPSPKATLRGCWPRVQVGLAAAGRNRSVRLPHSRKLRHVRRWMPTAEGFSFGPASDQSGSGPFAAAWATKGKSRRAPRRLLLLDRLTSLLAAVGSPGSRSEFGSLDRCRSWLLRFVRGLWAFSIRRWRTPGGLGTLEGVDRDTMTLVRNEMGELAGVGSDRESARASRRPRLLE